MNLSNLRMMIIGGGSLRAGETRRIDERVVAMAATPMPFETVLMAIRGRT